jgi:hypothetical protein
MDYALKDTPKEYFDTPVSSATSSPAFIRGVYCSGANISTILQYVGGAGSVGGYSDSQYNLWNTPIQNWAQNNACPFGQIQNVPENSDAGIDEAIIPETNVAQ